MKLRAAPIGALWNSCCRYKDPVVDPAHEDWLARCRPAVKMKTSQAEDELAKQFFSRENTVLQYQTKAGAGSQAAQRKVKPQVSIRDESGYDTDFEEKGERNLGARATTLQEPEPEIRR